MAAEPRPRPRGPSDPLARVLELGLAATIVLAPLPFGAVGPGGRLALEAAAFALLAVWLVRTLFYRSSLRPSITLEIGLVGLFVIALVQMAPLGGGIVRWVSPLSLEVREASVPAGEAYEAERRMLGVEPRELDPAATVSLDPSATASALRTGAALAALLLVATTVGATRGPRLLALALLWSAALQGLYGTLVLASGHPTIWHLPKKYYLDCATGTFINRNHFAGLLAGALPCGLALILARARWLPEAGGLRERLLKLFGAHEGRTLGLGLLLLLGLAGLLLSFSRAGIALGLAALATTALAGGRRRLRRGVLVVLFSLGVAIVPLAQIGAERLTARYARATEDLTSPGGRSVVWADTVRMLGASPLLGVGFGAFDAVYPLFRSPSVRLHYDHVHNDALQALAEGGLLAGGFLLLVLLPILREILQCLAGGRGPLAVGLAAGLGAMLLHGLVDFNFHIPSNAATASVLVGVLQGLSCNGRT